MSSTSLLPIDGGHLLFTQSSSFPNYHGSSSHHKWGWRRHQGGNVVAYRTNGHALQILTNPNVSSRKRGSNNEVIMVDPLEAKRLAAKQMEELKAQEKYKRKRQIEATNGAWAMIGLTAGLLVEAQTGKNIPTQLVDYWSAIADNFMLYRDFLGVWLERSPYRDFLGVWLEKSPYRGLLGVWFEK